MCAETVKLFSTKVDPTTWLAARLTYGWKWEARYTSQLRTEPTHKGLLGITCVPISRSRCLTRDLVSIFLNFATAFPSIVREFIIDAMRQAKMSSGDLRVARALYVPETITVGRGVAPTANSVVVRSGVPQGCRFSGCAFSLASFPLLKALAEVVGQANVFAFADDLALVIHSLRVLPPCRWSGERCRRSAWQRRYVLEATSQP